MLSSFHWWKCGYAMIMDNRYNIDHDYTAVDPSINHNNLPAWESRVLLCSAARGRLTIKRNYIGRDMLLAEQTYGLDVCRRTGPWLHVHQGKKDFQRCLDHLKAFGQMIFLCELSPTRNCWRGADTLRLLPRDRCQTDKGAGVVYWTKATHMPWHHTYHWYRPVAGHCLQNSLQLSNLTKISPDSQPRAIEPAYMRWIIDTQSGLVNCGWLQGFALWLCWTVPPLPKVMQSP